MNLLIILPNTLYKESKNFCKRNNCKVAIVKDEKFYTQYKYHSIKLEFQNNCISFFSKYLETHNIKFEIYEKRKDFLNHFNELCFNNVYCYNPCDFELKKIYKFATLLPNPMFLLSESDLIDFHSINNSENKIKISHSEFYKYVRIKLKIFVDKDNKPLFNKWSFDYDNRNKFDEYYFNNLSKLDINIDKFKYYSSYEECKRHLNHFIKYKLPYFGKYQDSFSSSKDIIVAMHSMLSPYLNNGLITPIEILKKIKKLKITEKSYSNIEGFIRQIIGWREYMRYCYLFFGSKLYNSNYFNNNKPITYTIEHKLWKIPLISNCIEKVNKIAYLHHIERLMIMGNLFLITEVNPISVYNWFMEKFIDAYEWVMVPNIFGMSQFSTNKHELFIVSRPYLCSVNYFIKMAYPLDKKGFEIWNETLKKFLDKKKNKLKNIHPYINNMLTLDFKY